MDDRRTIRSGLPRELSEELASLSPSLITVGAVKYRLERVAGRGSLFVTFRATRIDGEGAVPHALKVFRPSLLRAWPAGARILSREQARVLTILNERVPPSPNVVRLFEIGELDATHGGGERVPFFALEWIDGGTLFDRVRTAIATTGVGLDPVSALRVLEGVARGLDWVHRHGLLHRGLSPSNVLLGDVAKVSDVSIARPLDLPTSFGLAAETIARSSEPYRAPEQQANATLTPACDVFALGALAHFVITGKPRFQSLIGTDSIHPELASVAELDTAIAQLTAFEADDRPPTIESAWQILEPALRGAAAGASSLPMPRAERNEGAVTRVWTERHRPTAPRDLRAIAVDADGHALANDAGIVFFDGRTYRKPPPCAELDVIKTIRCVGPGAFLVGGRTARGRARLFRLDAEGWSPHPIDVSGSVIATLVDGTVFVRDDHEVAMIDTRGRIVLPGLRSIGVAVTLEGLIVISGNGGSFTIDPEQRTARPQRLPPATAGLVIGGELFLAAELGALIVARAVHGHRLHVAREHLPGGSATSLAMSPDGSLLVAVPETLLSRAAPHDFRPIFSEPESAACVAIAPVADGLISFLRDGRVLEGRAFAALPR